jgi:hypothetical protein
VTAVSDANARIWHGFRRHLAYAGLTVWLLLGAYPLIFLTVWAMLGRSFDEPVTHTLAQFVLPAMVQTASAGFAVAVLRTGDPVRSRRLTLWQVGLFFAGVAIYLGSSAAILG